MFRFNAYISTGKILSEGQTLFQNNSKEGHADNVFL